MSTWPLMISCALTPWSEEWSSCHIFIVLNFSQDRNLPRTQNSLWCHAALQSSGGVITAASVVYAALQWLMLKQFTSTQRKYITRQYRAVQPRPLISCRICTLPRIIFPLDPVSNLRTDISSLYEWAQRGRGEGAKYPWSWSWYAEPALLRCRNILFLTPMTGIKCSS